MARLNTHLSATPQIARSSTVDSLYRDPTPQSQPRAGRSLAGTTRESTYSVMSPSLSQSSDKENEQPPSRDNTPRPAKGKRPMATPADSATQPPTPSSGSFSRQPGNKRRRTGDYAPDVFEDEDEDEDVEDDASGDDVARPSEAPEEDEDAATKFYDPDQDPKQRRQLRANMRDHRRLVEDNRDELVKPQNEDLHRHVLQQNRYMTKVRQTADAALDSNFMVFASDLAGKKLNNTLHGNNGVGIDVDHFVSRLIQYMRTHGEVESGHARPSQSQSRRRTAQYDHDDDDDDEESGEALDWAWLGKEVCFGINKRPPVPGFLLGPLSVQKRTRVIQRKARLQRQPTGPATRPQELTQADLQKSETSNLSHLVKSVEGALKEHINLCAEQADQELQELDHEPTDAEAAEAFRRHRVYPAENGEGAVSLFEAVINPQSFGQTVENMFYISFLIREGAMKIVNDDDGLPLLAPTEVASLEEQRAAHATKQQAVFSIDYETWQQLIEAFGIKEPIIPHREPQENTVAPGGWYA